ncbi:MAG: DNA polymerase III, subunit gamma and tau [Candidatus Magasanikbacteria bacterium RIFCSPHIGHO2_01_FULL_33_34]|uniref:DNA polymerase III subunit gamma/tau n=1 Tax=Candidatus Magasanikbacteria bacterium RIFCSPHIGHO2_01_FULL_33_34 TaxID=1798671 RepID=A0A1F6LHU5_9BACT|nr:MAG: DNA polymerase III, subunit gamma and tau [Candidatus Magasanikbacteria bacterium RIFCSPHIGHO2_01_FULL_33_34]OGH65111.1 MAG: DNA polymerase III, subunit gamma and tau [Candidatus Magasanikbacteria bacterium RIFCSPHIGHO2_02_FULL_33_17]OGH75345.1 MAG: DNA polymerase III, subunit gamma and tau [Candidatus Magasanikbacteria bacterium RIFCSPLOWO2_01_FULL_33_34]OGH81272.1 MAG: DNA polymerase III, subunit gamma and tau [Candidatus Magasanikbacteria bacterium RIFCSPLOWO2_12_FULL_34_7]
MALYHRHRPQKFAELIGQEHIVQTITNQIKSNRIAHAYLFSGSRGIGKTTAARLLAKAINCEKREKDNTEPCNNCEICNEISKTSSIDVIEIDAASHTGVDNVRENIIENAQFRPTKSKYKVFIIDEAHMLSTPAFNALLKILEEPPQYVIFILATTEYHKLPITIISRCQRFNFKKVSYDAMKKNLEDIAKKENIKIDKDVIERIINKSDGSVRDSVSLLDQIMSTNEKHITSDIASIVLPTSNIDEIITLIESIINHETQKALESINKMTDEGIDMSQLAYDVIEILRIMLISKNQTKLTIANLDLNKEAEKKLLKLNKAIESSDIIKLIDLFIKRRSEIKMHTITQLPLELVIVEWSTTDTAHTKNNENNGENNDDNTKTEENNSKDETKDIKEDKKSIKEKVKELLNKESSISLDDTKEKWNDFMSKIEKKSTSLSFILKTATLEKIDGNTIIISVAFAIHKDKLMSAECKKNIEEILLNVYNTKILIDVIVNQVDEPNPKIDTEIRDLTAAFGGEI